MFQMHPAVQILLGILAVAGILISTLAALYLKAIKQCITKQSDSITNLDTKVSNVVADQAACKNECTRTYVDKVDFIRNVTKQERTLESLIRITAEIKGGLAIIEKIPQLCGEVTRQIVKDFKK